MKKEKSVRGKVIACAFVLLMVGAMFAGVVPVAAATTWTVDDPGGADFTSIQDAVDAANDGDTIIVRDGTYHENVDINKQLTLIGEGADVVTVHAASSSDHVFEITAAYVTITGFTATGATGTQKAGFCLLHGDYCNISYNTAVNNFYGIRTYSMGFPLSRAKIVGNTVNNNGFGINLYNTGGSIITGNIVNGNNGDGISLREYAGGNKIIGNTINNNSCGICLRFWSNNNEITGNNVYNNRGYGIDLESPSSGNTLTGNLMSRNRYNFALSDFDNDIDTTNLVDGKPIYFIKGASGVTFDSTTNAGTIYCIQCDAVTIKDLTFTNNSAGVYFYKTNNSRIENISALNNGGGIWLSYSNNNIIEGNIANENNGGIYLSYSSNNSITSNAINNNTANAIYLYYSGNNSIRDNTANNDTRGIYLLVSSNNEIIDNTVNDNIVDGILMSASSNHNKIKGNTVNSNSNGIYLDHSSNNSIEGNTADSNDYGIHLYSSSSNNDVISNTINNNSNFGIYLRYSCNGNNIAGNTAKYNSMGIRLYFSNNDNRITDNMVNNNVASGIRLYKSGGNNSITGNIAKNNSNGIQIDESGKTEILSNTVNNNTDTGIYLYYSSNSNVTCNTASNNDRGIYLLLSSNSNIYHNNFINNTQNVYDHTGANSWDNGAEGNYYSDYTGIDSNGDGIGDTPYPIPGGGSVDNFPLMEPYVPETTSPTCVIRLRQQGTVSQIDNINVGEFFDIYVGDSTDDLGIKEVRFSSDDSQDGNPTGEWTNWYDWDTSSGDWDVANKIKAWSFATAGDKEVWAEVKDGDGQTDKDSANIYANPPPIAKPVITSPLEITAKDIYHVGDTISAEFTITNRGEEPVTFDVLVVGGRDPNGEVVDFDKTYNIALDPSDSYDYQGYLTLPDKIGIYHFFCAYQTPDGNWNTNIDVEIDGEIVEDFSEAKKYRERDIIVFEETYISPAPPPVLWEKIDGPWDSWPTSLGNWNEAPQIAVNPNNPNEIYVEAVHRTNNWWEDQGGKLYKSTNGGDSWDLITQGLPGLTLSEYYWPIRAIAIAPSNPDIIYAGTTDFNPYSSSVPSGKGIYKSTNGGSDWTSVGGPYTGWIFKTYHSISSIVVNPIDSNIVYVGTVCGGIWRTTNGGESWENIWEEGPINNEAFLDVNALAVSPTNPNIIYAAAYNFNPLNAMGVSGLIPNRLIKSVDGGNTWERLSLGILTAVPKIDDIAIDNENADTVYAITYSFNVYKSTDGGQNWADASGTAGTDPLPSPIWLGPTWGSSNTIAIHHDHSNVIYAAAPFCRGIYFSPNSGENWFHMGLQDVCVKKLVFASNANYCFLYAAGIEGLFKLDLSEGLIEVTLRSHGELRVYDSQGRVTGLVNGEVKEEIPNSMYNEEMEMVMILSSSDSFTYEVRGTDEGSYGLGVATIKDREFISFTATNIPTSANTIHQYKIDGDALSQGEEGVTVQVDSDGDGTFEDTFTADNELSRDEFISATKGIPATIDFDPDTLNLQSEGKWVTTYIELPEGYDVSNINVSTIMLNDQVQAERKPTEIGDYDDDGIADLMVKFNRSAVQKILEVEDEVGITVSGESTDRTPFEGSDTIRVIDKGKGK